MRDVHVYGGIALVGCGLWYLIGPVSLAAVGVALFYLGVWRGK